MLSSNSLSNEIQIGLRKKILTRTASDNLSWRRFNTRKSSSAIRSRGKTFSAPQSPHILKPNGDEKLQSKTCTLYLSQYLSRPEYNSSVSRSGSGKWNRKVCSVNTRRRQINGRKCRSANNSINRGTDACKNISNFENKISVSDLGKNDAKDTFYWLPTSQYYVSTSKVVIVKRCNSSKVIFYFIASVTIYMQGVEI